jgi:gas vesicle protein
MADYRDQYEAEGSGGGFIMGLLAGTVLGAGLGMLLAPKAGADLRGQVAEQARTFGTKASEQYRRAGETATAWAERGREMVNQARTAAERAADEARGYTGATTGGSYNTGGTNYNTGTTGGDYNRS